MEKPVPATGSIPVEENYQVSPPPFDPPDEDTANRIRPKLPEEPPDEDTADRVHPKLSITPAEPEGQGSELDPEASDEETANRVRPKLPEKANGADSSSSVQSPTERVAEDEGRATSQEVGDETARVGSGGNHLVLAREAVKKFEAAEVSEAMEIVNRGLEAGDPAPSARALYLSLIAYSNLVKGEPGRALSASEQSVALLADATELSPLEKADVFYRMADTCEQLRNVPKGLEAVGFCIDLLIPRKGEEARLRRGFASQGRLFYLMRQYEKARGAFEKSLKYEGGDPRSWKLWHGIAKTYDREGRAEEAKQAYQDSRKSVLSKAQSKFNSIFSSGAGPGGSGKDEEKKGTEPEKSSSLVEVASPEKPVPVKATEAALQRTAEASGAFPIPPAAPSRPVSPPLGSALASRAFKVHRPLAFQSPPETPEETKPRSSTVPVVEEPKSATLATEERASETQAWSPREKVLRPVTLEADELPAWRLDRQLPEPLRVPALVALGVLLSFLLGWMVSSSGDAALNERIVKLDDELHQSLKADLLRLESEARVERAQLIAQLARLELEAGKPERAAAYTATAFEAIRTDMSPGVIALRKGLIALAETVFQSGRWLWRSPPPKQGEAPQAIALSPDGEILATLRADGKLRISALRTGKFLRLIDVQASKPQAMAFIGADRVALLSRDGRFRRWDVKKAKRLGSALLRDAPASAVAISPLGDRVVKGGADGSLRLWNAVEAVARKLESQSSEVKAIAYSPEGTKFACGTKTGELRIYDSAGERLARVKSPRGILSLAWSVGGVLLAARIEGGQVVLWRVRAKAVELEFIGPAQGESLAISHCEGRPLLALKSPRESSSVWEIVEGKRRRIASLGDQGDELCGLAFFAKGEALMTASARQGLRAWSVSAERGETLPQFLEAGFVAEPRAYVGRIVGLEVKGARLVRWSGSKKKPGRRP